MSVVITGAYTGNKGMLLTHGPSGATLRTAAPKDNNGDGSSFSPTDLMAASLGACMCTIIAIMAEREGVNIAGMHYKIEKIMSTEPPRKIAKLPLEIHLPKSLNENERKKYASAALTCPVHKSLGADVEVTVNFIYDL